MMNLNIAASPEDAGLPTDGLARDLAIEATLPKNRGAFYGGRWHEPLSGTFVPVISPGDARTLGTVADCGEKDAENAVAAARAAFRDWKRVTPQERAKLLNRMAAVLRENASELAHIDAIDCGNPVREMIGDVGAAANGLEFFAGLVTEMKGASIPMGPQVMNFSVREPLGVVAKLIPFNHPLMFSASRSAAPLAAGNTVVVKPPEQAPLSTLRLAELVADILPPGVFNVVPGGRSAGRVLASHPDVAKVSLIGSVVTGRAVMQAASDTVKPVMLELGGKNALIAFPDTDPDEVAAAVFAGMNFSWCGQSCGSTSRAFLHDDIHDPVISRLKVLCEGIRPGIPTDMNTRMGAIVSKAQFDHCMSFIQSAKADGAVLVCGGKSPADPALRNGYFIEPTVFAGVTPDMRIAREEIFGPVLSVMRWNGEARMIEAVNALNVGLTCAIWTRDLKAAMRTASEVEAGYVWINGVSKHFLGAPFGGHKQSGIGREECLEELLAYTQEKNININF